MSAVLIEADRLVWLCSVCGEPVEDGDGVLAVDRADPHSLAEPQRWLAWHFACRETPRTARDYGIEDVRTCRDLLARTAHLMDKRWLPETDWQDLIRRIGGAR